MTDTRSNYPLSVLCVALPDAPLETVKAQFQTLAGWTVSVESVATASEALGALSGNIRDLLFLEYPLSGEDSLGLLSQLRQLHPKTAVIVVTAGADEATAVACMKQGALDYVRHGDLPRYDFATLARRVLEVRYLVDQNMELRQVNQMKNEFIANVSHELRTPLSVIIGFAESLKTGSLGPIAPPQIKAVEAITSRAEDLLRTLNQILRIGEGQHHLLLKPLDLRDLAQKAAGRLPRDYSRKKIALECALPSDPVWVRADEEKLSIVLENLLSNAAKFGPAGSPVKLSLAVEGARARVTVADTGPGIPQEMMPRLFERFAAAAQGPTREHGGLGLGLPLSKTIVEQHSGRIWLESKDRRGCTAFVTLPLTQPDSPAMTVAGSPSLDKKRVLIVEDNPEIVDVLLLFMSGISGNLELAAARSGFEALEQIKERRPDLVILDVIMPGMDGYEVLERLRRSPSTAKIPVLVLTGYADAAQKAMAQGAQEVLLKPFERKTFCEKILQLLR